MRKIELKKITYAAALSEETSAYQAQVWADGVFICTVQNQGQGGCDMQYPAKGKTRADIDELDAYCKTLPARDTGMVLEGKPFIMEQDLETVCGDLLAAYLIERDVKRDLSRKFIFQKPGEKGIWQVKKIKGREAEQLAAIKAKNGIEKTLNEMPLAEVVKVYREAA